MPGNITLHYLDMAIVVGYLTLCLVIGLLKFDKIKTLRDYTLGIKPFSNTLLFSTIFATAIGLNRTVGVVEKSYALGLVFIIPSLVSPIVWLMMSKLLSPNFALFKQQKFMTLSDMMGYWYGKTGRWVSNACSICLAIAISAASITAIGYLCSHFLGISPIYGELIAVIIITLYSTLGGVQAVAYTDLCQMIIFFVALPVLCAIGLSKAGGIENVLSSLPAKHLTIDSSNILLFLSFLPYMLLPTSGMPFIQRALIAKDRNQLAQTFNFTGVGVLFFLMCMSIMGLTVYVINPNINPNTALYYFMGNYLYPGLLGLVIAGLLAVIMSTQDSYLNSVSSAIARDILPAVTDKNQLITARLACVAITIASLSVSFAKDSILGTFWLVSNFWDPLVTIPLISGLLGVKILKKDFLWLTIACVISVICVRIFTGVFDTRSHSIGAITAFVALCIAHLRFKALHPDASPSRIPEILSYLKEAAITPVFNPPAVHIFSLTMLVGLIASIFILPPRQDLLALHIVSTIFCVLLLFKGLLSKNILKLYLRKFWYITLLFCLPLSYGYPLFISKLSISLVVNFGLSLTLLYILVSPVAFLSITSIGIALGYALATASHLNSIMEVASMSTFGVYSCFFTTIGILMQIYNKRYVSKAVCEVLENRVAERTEKLQLALAAKKEFLGKVGHEIRTPLQGIIATSQTLHANWKNLAEAEKYKLVSVLAGSGNRLMGLMNNILDLSQFSLGKIEAVFAQNIDIKTLIKDAIKIGESLAETENKNITFKIKLDVGVKRKIECDSTRITQVLINLINNAVSYSNDGEITVRVSDTEGKIKISVSDNGVGIPKKELAMIFDAFTQSSRTKDPSKGRGLGLAVCREIIGLHQGHIWAENKTGKSGSTFSFVIPYEQTPITTQALSSKPQLKGRVLLVDDEALCLQTGEMCLSSIGLEVAAAKGGMSALEYLKAHSSKIDLILLDIMMPDMYGLNVLETIKSDPNLKHIPVIIQSGLLDPQEIAKARKLGAAGHLSKPYGQDILYTTIQKLLKKKDLVVA